MSEGCHLGMWSGKKRVEFRLAVSHMTDISIASPSKGNRDCMTASSEGEKLEVSA